MRAVDQVISALREHGTASSNWLVGEPCVGAPNVLRESLAKAAVAESFPYPPPAGLWRLREILAEHHRVAEGTSDPEQIVVTNGAKGGLLAVLASLLEPGDEMIHPVPCYPAYPAMAARIGAHPVPVTAHNASFDGWPQAVADHLGPRTRVVVLSSPSNPTGATLTSGQAAALVDLCRSHGVRLVCDEAYTEFRYDPGTPPLDPDLDPDRNTVIQLRSASKSWALCGWRLGWVVADRDLATTVASRHTSLLNPASGPAQEALTTLPKVPASYLDRARSAVAGRIDEVVSALESGGLDVSRPAGGFYIWLDLRERMGTDDTAALCVDLALKTGVGLWPGEDFGSPGHVRLAVTAPHDSQWQKALENLTAALC